MPRLPGTKRKRLTIEQKLDLLDKMDDGWSVYRRGRGFLYIVTIAGEPTKPPRPHRQGHLHTTVTPHTNITQDITHTRGF